MTPVSVGEVSMKTDGETESKRERTWREIAEELSRETNSERIATLSQELLLALDGKNRPAPSASTKTSGTAAD
jgi:hypothetical protein